MKVRVLWVPPSERKITPGKVYDLADGQEMIERGEAEAVDEKTAAAKDPRGEEDAAPARKRR